MLRTLTLGALMLTGFQTLPTAQAQDDARMESVVVTATRVDADDLAQIPNATLRVRADFVLFELTYVNSTLDMKERRDEMKRQYDRILRELPRHNGLKLLVGDAEASAAIETAVFDEVYASGSSRGVMDFVVRADVSDGLTHTDLRARVEAFVEGSGEIGRSQSMLDDEQYLGVDNLKRYRPTLIKTIWDDIYAVSNPVGDTDLHISGLEGRTQYLPVGPLELELFIPYEIDYSTVVKRGD